ncbi:DUF4913 domain-containing protein [Streptomyces specialis]|uniref:DUF4913 domain-containing protein n=1 Tax=Streptomyces specialis TaxID=498367 RepID=UPI00073F98CE|nr:DUF4913 domain-containing protein [Streptomyces specialis]
MPDTPQNTPAPFRVSDDDLEDLASTLAKTVAQVRQHGLLLDRISDAEPRAGDSARKRDEGPASAFILALDGDAYAAELAALTDWVNYLFLPVYGREISTTRPWCHRWHEHPEAVARLHALWLAWQQLTDIDAGPTGPSVWHRDHLDQALVHLRAPDGPFAACTTSPGRPHHRLHRPPPLPPPAPEVNP